MTEEWLVRLANQIKDKERKGAEEAAHYRRRVDFLKQRGPAFWKLFADSLEQSVGDLKNLLEGDVTLSEGPLKFLFDPATLRIDLGKAAFPMVRFTAIPQFEREAAEMSYVSADVNSQTAAMNCQFQAGSDGRIVMRLDGRPFANPADAATFVMERLFRVSASRHAESRDSHLGRVGSE